MAQFLYIFVYLLAGIMGFFVIAQALLTGSAGIAIRTLILTPIMFMLIVMTSRLVLELAISLLMLPHILTSQHKMQMQLFQLQQQHLEQASSTQPTQPITAACPEGPEIGEHHQHQQQQQRFSTINIDSEQGVNTASV